MDDGLEVTLPSDTPATAVWGGVGGAEEVRTEPRPSLARGGVLLGAGSAAANVLSYAFTVVVSRSLGPAGYGAVAALLAAGVIAAIPAVALQLVTARRVAVDPHAAAAGEGVRLSFHVGLVLVALMCLVSPALSHFLHLEGPLPVVLLGVSLLPLTLTGAYQGVLLGTEKYGRLALALVLTSGGRLTAALVAAVLGWQVVGVLAATSVATAVTAVAVSRLSATPLLDATVRVKPALREFTHAAATIAGLFVLTNVDVLLARHFLAPRMAGAYALGALFAKAALWGSLFVPLLFFPGLAKGGSDRGLLLKRSAGLTVGLGAAFVVGTALLAAPIVHAMVGSAYDETIGHVWVFALLGTLWALVQLLMLSGLTIPSRPQNLLLWSATGAEVLLVSLVLHNNLGEILAACLLSTTLLLVAVVSSERRRASGR